MGTGPDRSTPCPRCETPHHQDCWDYLGHCGVFGCSPAERALLAESGAGLRLRRLAGAWWLARHLALGLELAFFILGALILPAAVLGGNPLFFPVLYAMGACFSIGLPLEVFSRAVSYLVRLRLGTGSSAPGRDASALAHRLSPPERPWVAAVRGVATPTLAKSIPLVLLAFLGLGLGLGFQTWMAWVLVPPLILVTTGGGIWVAWRDRDREADLLVNRLAASQKSPGEPPDGG